MRPFGFFGRGFVFFLEGADGSSGSSPSALRFLEPFLGSEYERDGLGPAKLSSGDYTFSFGKFTLPIFLCTRANL